jgi:tetratricopeptide (TPR) repeat protein
MRRRRKRPNWFYIILLSLMVLGASYVTRYIVPEVEPIGVASPTPTRDPESYVTEAVELFNQGKLLQSIDTYQQAVAANPNDPTVYVALARVQVWAGQYPEAQTSAENALLLNPNNSMAHAVLAWALDFGRSGGEAPLDAPEPIERPGARLLSRSIIHEIGFVETSIRPSRIEAALTFSLNTIGGKPRFALDATGIIDIHPEYQARLINSTSRSARRGTKPRPETA